MKAVQVDRLGGPDVLQIKDIERPAPGDDDVLVKVEAAGVNFADILMRRGEYVFKPRLPYTPGLEFVGRVDTVGGNVKHLKKGDRVAAIAPLGGYAEYAVAAAASALPLSSGITAKFGCALPISGMTAYHLAHTVVDLRGGETAVVYAAAGSVGAILCQLLNLRGVRVIALVGSEKKKAFLRRLDCAEGIINYTKENVAERVLEITSGRGAEVIYNSVAAKTVRDDFRMVSDLGTVVIYGQAGGAPSPKELYVSLMKEFTRSPALRLYYLTSSIRERPREHQAGWFRMLALVENKHLDIPIHGMYPLEDAAYVQEAVETRKTSGKVLLKP
ncbi:zinc-binding dehydrogenase [bacterium]|nr:zinc-binding dehydrogenase [bacterium]